MSKINDRAYREKTIAMINGFTEEQKDEKLLEFYIKQRKANEKLVITEQFNISKALELETAMRRLTQLTNQITYNHVTTYRIRCSVVSDDTTDADQEILSEFTAQVYHHQFDAEDELLIYVDHEFNERRQEGVVSVSVI